MHEIFCWTKQKHYLCCQTSHKMITILDIGQYKVKLKATIQQTGRLGFTADTADRLHLSEETYVQFARDDEGERTLYMVLHREPTGNSFRVMKSGKYFYLPTKQMFDAFGEDYERYNIMFDLVRTESLDAQLGGQVYKMSRRMKERPA